MPTQLSGGASYAAIAGAPSGYTSNLGTSAADRKLSGTVPQWNSPGLMGPDSAEDPKLLPGDTLGSVSICAGAMSLRDNVLSASLES